MWVTTRRYGVSSMCASDHGLITANERPNLKCVCVGWSGTFGIWLQEYKSNKVPQVIDDQADTGYLQTGCRK